MDRRSFLNNVSLCAGVIAASGLSSAAWSAPASRATTATTQAGKVRGLVSEGIHCFKGIRYGADTGARRFMPPVAPVPWKQVADATEYGAASPQTGKEEETTNEDCLFL